MKQVVILCAGKGTRLAPLTDGIPKSLVDVNGKSILEHKLSLLDGLVGEVILVVGHLGEKIKEKIKDNYGGLKIKYVEQKEILGSGHAVLQTKELLKGEFIVLNGDDFYSKEDLKNLLNEKFAISGFELEDPRNFGVLELDSEGNLVEVEEKPENPKSNLVNIGAYAFDVSIFEKELEKSPRGDYEIIDYLNYLVDKGEKIKVLKTISWLPVNNLKELEIAKKNLK